ncbi:MAG: ABC transporter permease [Jatrophihabitantaceae bacterium]
MSAQSSGAVRAEWIKLRSVRSTYLTVGIAIALGLGVGLLDIASTVHHWTSMTATDRTAFDPVGDSFSGFQFGELSFGALGVLAISTEYGTGLIRSTLTAVPSRRQVFATKTLVLGTFALIVCQVCAFGAFFLGQAILSRQGLDVGLGQPHVLRAVTCAGLYMAVVTMVGFGLGALIRHTAGAMAAMVAVVFLAWPAARAVESFTSLPDRLLLVNAADTLTATHPHSGPHPERIPSFGFACLDLILYLAVFLSLAAWRISRDA